MNGFISKFIDKLFVKQWQIGLCKGDIAEIIRSKVFNPEIKWLPLNTLAYFHADPFLLKTNDGSLNILFEDFAFKDYYGKIASMKIDENFNQGNKVILLDTKSHLSYPFIISENNRTFVFPEAGYSGRLTCYEYDEAKQILMFHKVIMDLPVLDPTIIKYNNKYWMFGTLIGKDSDKKLNIYFADDLLGPYTHHPGNPVKDSMNGSRPAGSFIVVDNNIYRPSQNSENQYGESITINKVVKLDETSFVEEPYMDIQINQNKKSNGEILTIHTLNVVDDVIVVDGTRWTFSPRIQLKNFLKNRPTPQV
jgi:hypothetical protein